MVSATTSGRVISISLTEATALASVGGAAIVDTSLGTYLVAKTGESAYTALIATCTHEGSPITAYNGSRFVCLTHGSQYTTTGTVAVGPATRSLSSYPTQVNGTTLTITV
jgi:cytochrome b6-f complex iron-sulfur subunit